MVQFSRVRFMALATVLITTCLPVPIQAALRQQSQQLLIEKKETYLALSWGDIWRRLTRNKRPGGGRGEICEIAPVKLVDPNSKEEGNIEIWSDRPLFLWGIKKGTAKQIQLFRQGNEKPLWSRDIKAGETKVIYDGEALQPGQIYEWQLSALVPFLKKSSGVKFQVMESQKRDRISKELTALEERLKGSSQETIAMEKADYFAQQGLWSDALRELYLVSAPSAELTGMIRQIEAHDFCAKDKPTDSASR